MTCEVAKQIIFECAVELIHGSENTSKEDIANKLLDVLRRLDTKEAR